MILNELCKDIKIVSTVGSMNKDIMIISQDSRIEDQSHGLYIAVRGTQSDGHDFIPQAIEKGATAIVCEQLPEYIHESVTYIIVEDSRKSVGIIASTFYGNPSQQLIVIAVTGTNGKTTVVTYTAQLLELLGNNTLLLSTAGDYFNNKKININRKASSSLEIIELHNILRKYVDLGAQYVCLEATSHALHQDRLSGIDIDIAIFTNLTHDHIDYHKTISQYAEAKSLLFKNLKKEGLSIINRDDSFSKKMLTVTHSRKITYGKSTEANYVFRVNTISQRGSTVVINDNIIDIPIVGEFNVYNITAVYSLLRALDYSHKEIAPLLEKISVVPGRMELVNNNREALVIVDYAHTPDALENVLETLGEIPHTNIITVIGCGGDRDRSKRSPMAKISQLMSDHVIYTADNPRTEDLDQIFSDMKEGVVEDNKNFIFIPNREDAIKHAVASLKKRDILLVAGKGHEDYQIIGTEKQHFDDREIIEKYLNIL